MQPYRDMRNGTFRERPTPSAQRPIFNAGDTAAATADVDLIVFTIETSDFALRFPVDRALFKVGAFVTCDFSLPHTKFGFEFPVFPVELQNDQSAPAHLCFAVEFVDLLSMQEKFADTFGGWNLVAGFFVRLDIGVVEKSLAVLDAGEGIADVCFAAANGFDLAALQLDTSFVALENVKIAERLAIKDRLGRHDRVGNAMEKLRVVR